MKQSTRKRFFRAFVSSILASEMTEADLMEMLNEIQYDPEFIFEIKRGMKVALDVLDKSGASGGGFMSQQEEPYEAIYETIKKRRLSKSMVYDIIKMAIGEKTSKYMPETQAMRETQTMRELLASFYLVASKREQERFLELLGYTGSMDDKFLQGIIRNR